MCPRAAGGGGLCSSRPPWPRALLRVWGRQGGGPRTGLVLVLSVSAACGGALALPQGPNERALGGGAGRRPPLRGVQAPGDGVSILRLFGGRGRTSTRGTGSPVAVRSGSWDWVTAESSGLSKVHKVALAVSFYFFTSLSLTFMNKTIFNRFAYPLLVTCYQQIITCVLLWSFGTLGERHAVLSFAPPPEFNWNTAAEVLPLTVLYVGMLSATNFCLRHVDISFYQILRSLVIPFNIFTSYLFLGYVPCVCCVCVRARARVCPVCVYVLARAHTHAHTHTHTHTPCTHMHLHTHTLAHTYTCTHAALCHNCAQKP